MSSAQADAFRTRRRRRAHFTARARWGAPEAAVTSLVVDRQTGRVTLRRRHARLHLTTTLDAAADILVRALLRQHAEARLGTRSEE